MAASRSSSSAVPLLRQLAGVRPLTRAGLQRQFVLSQVAPPLNASLVTPSSSRRGFASTSLCTDQARKEYPGQDRNRASPARAHRADASSGGPDNDPLTGTPRNASTETVQQTSRSGTESLADLAQSISRRNNAAAAPVAAAAEGSSSLRPTSSNATAPEVMVVPSGYSTKQLALKSDPLLEAFVNNLMRDGKKASAQRHILDMMNYLAQVLHANPLPALQAAIDMAAPLARMQTRKQGGKNIQVPLALRYEQGRRRAIVAIIDASKKRGDKDLSVRLAKEIIAILEGTSPTLQRKEEIHRLAMVNRGNMSVRI